jgi:hypothetical protein
MPLGGSPLIQDATPRSTIRLVRLVWRGHLRAPLRHAAVSLHRLQMRSPAHALGNGDRQIRHFLIFCSVDRADSDFSCVPPAAEPWSSDVLFTSGKGFALSLRLLTLWSISRRPACHCFR